MSTKKSQRIGIWIITGALVVGTLGSFLVMILAPKNQASDQARSEKLMSEYQTKVAAQAKELSGKYFSELSQYSDRVAAFDKDAVTELKTEDLKIGDGADITKDSTFTAYYIGWNPTGEIFDQSIDSEALKAPFSVSPNGVIKGWTEGAAGMKIGGVRELTIPASLAYGEAGSGEKIPANTPLKFVIMIIPTPPTIEIPAELLEMYQKGML